MDTVITDKDNKVVEIHKKQNSKHKFNSERSSSP